MDEAQEATLNQWLYEHNGQRKGPISEREIIQLIKTSAIFHGTLVWRQELQSWLKVENTDLGVHLDTNTPPPLSGEHINNTLVWVLAFAPLIGLFLEGLMAGIMHAGNGYAAQTELENSDYWFVTLALNIALAFLDERRLKKAGHDTEKFKGWVWLVPVYLLQRAKATKQNRAYFIVWIACFVLVLFS